MAGYRPPDCLGRPVVVGWARDAEWVKGTGHGGKEGVYLIYLRLNPLMLIG